MRRMQSWRLLHHRGKIPRRKTSDRAARRPGRKTATHLLLVPTNTNCRPSTSPVCSGTFQPRLCRLSLPFSASRRVCSRNLRGAWEENIAKRLDRRKKRKIYSQGLFFLFISEKRRLRGFNSGNTENRRTDKGLPKRVLGTSSDSAPRFESRCERRRDFRFPGT